MVKKMLSEIRLCNPMTNVFKENVKIINVSILNGLKISFFLFLNTEYMHKHNETRHYVDKMFFYIWTL